MRKAVYKIKKIMVVILVAALSIGGPVPVFAEGLRYAIVTELSGEVKVTVGGGETAFPAFKGMSLTEGDGITTGAGSTITLEIDEDKEVTIGENSQVNLSELAGAIETGDDSTGIGLVVGKLWANIKKKLNIRAKFEVKTPTAVMGVRGTKFYVTRSGGKTNVGLLEGNLVATAYRMVEQPGAPAGQQTIEIVLSPNQRVQLDDTVQKPEEVKVEKVTLESLDRFVLEAIKENSQGIDPKLLENIDKVIEEKKVEEEKKKQEEPPAVKEKPKTDYTPVNGAKTEDKPKSPDSGSRTVHATGVSISETLEVGVNNTGTLTATISPSNATNKNVNWSSSNTSIATVAGSGLTGTVTGVSAGTATITVTTADGSYSDTCTVTVVTGNIPVTGVSISETLEVGVANTGMLTATISPSGATNKNVTWTSNNEAVATVTASGLTATVTGVTAGSATITVTTADGSYSDTCVVTVISVNLSSSSMSLKAGLLRTLTATVLPDEAFNKNVSWSITSQNPNNSNDEVVKIIEVNSTNHTVSFAGISAGTAVITATTAVGNKTAACTVMVMEPAVTVDNYIEAFSVDNKVSVVGILSGADSMELYINGEKVAQGTDSSGTLSISYYEEGRSPGANFYKLIAKSGSTVLETYAGYIPCVTDLELSADNWSVTISGTAYAVNKIKVTVENQDRSIKYPAADTWNDHWIDTNTLDDTEFTCEIDLPTTPSQPQPGIYDLVVSFELANGTYYGVVVGHVFVNENGIAVTRE